VLILFRFLPSWYNFTFFNSCSLRGDLVYFSLVRFGETVLHILIKAGCSPPWCDSPFISFAIMFWANRLGSENCFLFIDLWLISLAWMEVASLYDPSVTLILAPFKFFVFSASRSSVCLNSSKLWMTYDCLLHIGDTWC